MDHLYIVELDVQSADTAPVEPFGRLLEHIQEWLTHVANLAPTVDLSVSGAVDLPGMRGADEFMRRARWTTEAVGAVRLFHLSMRQPMEGVATATFATEVTVFNDAERTVLRIELGREVDAGMLTPASVRTLRRPGLLGQVLRDSELVCTSQNQPVTGQPSFVNGEFAVVIPEVIKDESRLPLLVVDGRTSAARGLAHTAAPELAGLVQVVILDSAAMDSIQPELQELGVEVPPNGARLIWPTLSARHPQFSEGEVRQWRGTTGTLLWMVGSVSVPARGHNRWTRVVADETRRLREREFEDALKAATTAGDSSAEVEALRTRVKDLSSEVEMAFSMAAEYEKQVIDLQSSKAEAAYFKSQWLRHLRDSTAKGEQSWSDAPVLSSEDLGPLADFLTETSDGAVVFTPNALRSWKQSRYPHVERMQEHLVVLAQAAVAWRSANC